MTVFVHTYGYVPLFDPAAGETVVAPTGAGSGYWVGAPSVAYDPDNVRFLLSYRVRVPRELGRGVESRIAASKDGHTWETIWSVHKSVVNSASMERFSLTRRPDGSGWLLYPSFVDPADDRWRIDVVEARRPEDFDLRTRRNLYSN